MKNEIKHRMILFVTIVIAWQFLYIRIDNPIILPSLGMVLRAMAQQLQDPNAYLAVGLTLYRVIMGTLVALLIAMVLAVLTIQIRPLKHYVKPLVSALKSIPNISYIIIVLIWFGSEASVMIIIFLVLFPIFFYNILTGFETIDPLLLDVLRIYPVSRVEAIWNVYLPLSMSYLKSAIASGFGLGFKVGIMAEILGQVRKGVGKLMYIGKINLEMDQIFAWTLWVIILLFLFESAIDGIFAKITS